MAESKDDLLKKQEFKEVIKRLKEDGQSSHWVDVARASGVAPSTITRWKELPEAKQAIQEGITYAINQMENAGRKDWRMWESKLKMLGVNPAQRLTHEGSEENPIELILKLYGGGKGEGIDELPTTEEGSPKVGT